MVRDALGRETVTRSAFYASPDLLAPGVTDFSVEAGFARRNYAIASFGYDGRPALSASWRRGISDRLTLQAHAETAGSLVLVGGGTIFTLGHVGLVSIAGAGSRTRSGTGALVDLGVESRLPSFTISLRTLRTFGDYQDLASWTAVLPPDLPGDRRIFGQPRELDQALISLPLPWSGGSFGASYVYSRREDERSRIVSLSFSQDLGRVSLFASAFRDFEQSGSTGIFLGLSLPLGHGVTATAGGSRSRGAYNGYVELSRQGNHQPGQLGWLVRGAAGERQEAEAILRYGTTFAQVEGGLLRTGGDTSAHLLVEGALTLVGGGVHASQRVDQSFALVEVGAPGVTILHENRPVGTSNRRGQLLVPNLAPFTGNRIALDPAGLPIDAEVASTSATVAPYDRVGVLVDFAVRTGANSALVAFVDPDGAPIELGARVEVEGQTESYVVGYDGEAYLSALAQENIVVVTTPDRARCRARFGYRPSAGGQVRIEAVRCEPLEARR